jgi:hypothetical protein
MADLKQVVEQVKAEAKHAQPRATVLLPLPIYDGRFIAEFGVLPSERFERFSDLPDDMPDVEKEHLTLDFIADACRQIHAKIDGKREPLTANGQPVRFDEAFAEALGLDLSENTAAGVVRACWTLDDGTYASVACERFGFGLIEWMGDTTKPVEGEVVGGSHGGRSSNGRAALPSTV